MEHLVKKQDKAALFSHVRDFLVKGLTIQFMGGMTNDRMYAAFEHAKALYHEGNYQFALEIFKYLCLQNHLNKTYFMYLGACYQRMSRADMALKAYTHASALDPGDPRPHYNAAVCYLADDNLAGAEYAAADAQIRIDGEVWTDGLQERVETLQRTINTLKHKAA